jgi:hypothetical protein
MVGFLPCQCSGVHNAHGGALARLAEGDGVAEARAVAAAARGHQGHLILQTHGDFQRAVAE